MYGNRENDFLKSSVLGLHNLCSGIHGLYAFSPTCVEIKKILWNIFFAVFGPVGCAVTTFTIYIPYQK